MDKHSNGDASSSGTTAAKAASLVHTNAILTDLSVTGSDGWEDYNETHSAVWASVFGTSNADLSLIHI